MSTLLALQLKHLEMVQSTIKRLSQNSFVIKGWSVTLVSVVFAVAKMENSGRPLFLVTLVPTFIFWGLDAYYLQHERLYRKLYDSAAKEVREGLSAPSVDILSMNTQPYRSQVGSWASTLFSKTVLPVPLTLALVILIYWLMS
jgi:hypothetical protein